MRTVDYIERFDVVLNWFNSFGYFGLEEDFEMLKRLVRARKAWSSARVRTASTR